MKPELKEKLHKAIDLAEGPSECLYVKDKKPCCVIGQFGFLLGYSIGEINNWVMIGYGNFPDLGVPSALLIRLQCIWDSKKEDFLPKTRKLEMHALVNAHT